MPISMFIYMYMYIFVYMHIHVNYSCVGVYIYIHVLVQACLSGHSQSLTVPVEVGYCRGAAVGSPKSDFPQQRLGTDLHPAAQSGSDWSQKGMSISEVCF